jgi:hypothetical protein
VRRWRTGGRARAAAVASTPTAPPPAAAKPARQAVAVAKPIAPPTAPVKIVNPGLALRAVWGEYDLRHTGGGRIVAAGFRRDGSYVSVGDTGSVRGWDMAKRRLLADWSALIADDAAERAAVSPDGAHAALWLRARHRLVILRVGDARTPSAVLHEIADARAIRALAFAGADALFSVGVFGNPATRRPAAPVGEPQGGTDPPLLGRAVGAGDGTRRRHPPPGVPAAVSRRAGAGSGSAGGAVRGALA